MNLEIEKVENGYICSWWEEVENEHVKKQMVFEEVGDELPFIERVLYFIVEHLNMIESWHDDGVSIKVESRDNTA